MWYKNIAGRFFGLVTKHACDKQTDGRTELRLPSRDEHGPGGPDAAHGPGQAVACRGTGWAVIWRPGLLKIFATISK